MPCSVGRKSRSARALSVLLCILLPASVHGQTITQLGADIVGADAGAEFGTSVSLNAVGTRVAIGAPVWSSSKGKVQVYERFSGGAWTQLGQTISGTVNNRLVGESVSLNSAGDRIAVGEPNGDRVKVYEYDTSTSAWSQLGATINGEAGNDDTGQFVSLSSDGSRLAIGAPGNDGAISNGGHVRVFEYSGGAWSQMGDDIDGTQQGGGAGMCCSLSADGTRVLVAAPEAQGGGAPGNNRGQSKVFEYSGGAWSQLGSAINGVREPAAHSSCCFAQSSCFSLACLHVTSHSPRAPPELLPR